MNLRPRGIASRVKHLVIRVFVRSILGVTR